MTTGQIPLNSIDKLSTKFKELKIVSKTPKITSTKPKVTKMEVDVPEGPPVREKCSPRKRRRSATDCPKPKRRAPDDYPDLSLEDYITQKEADCAKAEPPVKWWLWALPQ